MNVLVPITMFGWIPAVLGIFALMSPRRAVIAAFLLAWLFLPVAEYKVPGITAYTKMTATCAGIMLAVAIFDAGRLLSFRAALVDLPMVLWCVCPFASSMSNGLGIYDGLSAVIYQTITWGLPYFIGRLYFSDAEGVRELAVGIFIGGLIYMPLCLYEIRMSPQLHRLLYGFDPQSWLEAKRAGGFRPMVFMQHGLMVGMWMTTASLAGVWLWANSVLKRLFGFKVGWLVAALLVTTVLCKSSGAIVLLGLGLAAMSMAKYAKTTAALWLLVIAAPIYMGLRASGAWSGANLVSLSADWGDADRTHSLQFRLDNEDMLAAKALQQPVFGWGGWGRGRVYNEQGQDISVTDGLWIIALGQRGFVGLGALTLSMLLPAVLLLCRYRAASWSHWSLAPATAMAVLLVLYMIDNLFNGMVNPVFALAAGATAGFAAGPLCALADPAELSRRLDHSWRRPQSGSMQLVG